MVGVSGISGRRFAVADAIVITLPASDMSFERLIGAKYICASPRITAVTASGALLNGTWTRSTPAALRNKAPAMKVVLASPGEEKLSVPGLDFASAMRSFRERGGRSGLVIR